MGVMKGDFRSLDYSPVADMNPTPPSLEVGRLKHVDKPPDQLAVPL